MKKTIISGWILCLGMGAGTFAFADHDHGPTPPECQVIEDACKGSKEKHCFHRTLKGKLQHPGVTPEIISSCKAAIKASHGPKKTPGAP